MLFEQFEKDSFLSNYLNYTQNNECPTSYHLFVGLALLSSLASRKVWLDMGYFEVFPNTYTILVGPPATGKSTAMNLGKNILREINDACKGKFDKTAVPLSAEAQTRESILVEMAKESRTIQIDDKPYTYSPYTCFVTELSQFLGGNNTGSFMMDFITTIWDEAKFENKTKNKGTDILLGPYFVLFGCTTPKWVSEQLRSDVISGGFSRRCLFVYETEKSKHVAFPSLTAAMEESKKRCVARGLKILDLKGPFKWSQEAHDWYVNWYENIHPTTISKDENLEGYFGSKQILLLKLAMLCQLSNSDELVLKVKNLEDALFILSVVEKNLGRVFEGIGRNSLRQVEARCLELLAKAPNQILPEKFLRQQLFKDATVSEISELLAHMVETGSIVKLQENTPAQSGMPCRFFYQLKK